MEQQEAERKFKKLEGNIFFLEGLCKKFDKSETKNETSTEKFKKTKIMLGLLKAGYNG